MVIGSVLLGVALGAEMAWLSVIELASALAVD